jgi:carbon-monoxide dehydrogenase small subunit
MSTAQVTLTVNGRPTTEQVDLRTTLVDLIRRMGLTGTHVACTYEGRCGACTVLMDGFAVKSCLVLAVQADGAEVRTVEGLETDDGLHPVQDAFWRHHGLQCGYCTPGMLMTTCDLLRVAGDSALDEADIREGISGNLCRCTGYVHIVESIRTASTAVRALPAAERNRLLGSSEEVT